jgi:ribose transport system ATP-binding protein
MASESSAQAAPLLAARRIAKSYGPVEVLHDVDFDVRPGEVHALLGENGAGKSTLVKILAGFVPPSAGTILLQGEPVQFTRMRDAEDAGIVLIHQDFNLAELRSVEENIFLGREITRGPFTDGAAMRTRARQLLDRLNCAAPVTARVCDLPVADKQMIEIAKALSRDARVLILDEPTAVLTEQETGALFALIAQLKAAGVGLVYISHKLAEVERIADRITVLRDGEVIDTVAAHTVSQDDMARMMVGRELTDFYPHIPVPPADAEVLLEVSGLASGKDVLDASFALRRGEVLGFAGLQGAGRTALMEAVVGLRPRSRGSVQLRGQPVSFRSLAEAKAAKLAYLTKDRKGKGLLLGSDLVRNFSLLALDSFATPFIDRRRERDAFAAAARRFDLRAASPKMTAGSLSGGNQQKLLLAKVLAIEPEIVIIDEPTRGIDVGAKAQIYGFVANLIAEGCGVIVLSSELPELIGLSHRVAVMHAGRLVATLEGADINEEEIMRHASGLGAAGASAA